MILDENVKHEVKSTTAYSDKSVDKKQCYVYPHDYPSVALDDISFHYSKHHHHYHQA